jgi:hypothetical protein
MVRMKNGGIAVRRVDRMAKEVGEIEERKNGGMAESGFDGMAKKAE